MEKTLIGLRIHVNGRPRFVGKVGSCPRYPAVPVLEGARIMYRDEPKQNVVLRAGNLFSFDRKAWDTASDNGALYFVNWCPDTRQLLIVPKPVIENEKVQMKDMGELPQYRIPMRAVVIYDEAQPIDMGYTTQVIDLETSPAPSATTQAAKAFDEHMRQREQERSLQMSMF